MLTKPPVSARGREGAVRLCKFSNGAWAPFAPNHCGRTKGKVTLLQVERARRLQRLARRLGRRPTIREFQKECKLSSASVAHFSYRMIERNADLSAAVETMGRAEECGRDT